MPRHPTRLLLPTLTLIALIFLSSSLAAALPLGQTGLSAAERSEVVPGLFSKLWELLSAVWANGSALEPDGANVDPSTEPNSGTTGDNGSGLDPNGRP